MICSVCGGRTADDSNFCIHCGNSLPCCESVNDDEVNKNHENAKRFIETAGTILAPAITAFVIGLIIPVIGDIYALIKYSFIEKQIKSLPAVDESLLDPETFKEYKTACSKISATRILSKIANILSVILIIQIVFWVILFTVLFAVLIIGLIVLAVVLLVIFLC